MPTRERYTGGLFQQPLCYMWSRGNGCSQPNWVQTASVGTIRTGEFRWMSDTVVPHFKSEVSKGKIFFNPMHSVRHTVTSFGGDGFSIKSKATSCNSPVTYHEYEARGDFFAYVVARGTTVEPKRLFNAGELALMMDECSTAVLADRGKGPTNLWETLAEFRQTLDMLSVAVGKGHRFLDGLQRGMPPANAWLVYRYGIRPLISDVTSILTSLQQKTGRRRWTTRAGLQDSRSSTSNLTYDHDYVRETYSETAQHNVQIRGMSLDELFVTIPLQLGLSGKGFLTVPWELIPYSFVVDWFVNVGDWLNASVPLLDVNNLGSALVVKHDCAVTYQQLSTAENGGLYSVVRPLSGLIHATKAETIRTALTKPTLLIRGNFGFSKATRVGDALALVGQRIARRFSPSKNGPTLRAFGV